MAENTLGALIVRLVMDDKAFQKSIDKNKASIGAFGSDLDKIGSTISSTVTAALTAATAAATGFVAATAYIGAGFEKSITRVGAIADATDEQLGALTKQARFLGATTAYTATEAADAMQELAQAGLNTSQIIAASGDALILAGAAGTDMATSTSLLASTMNQFGLAAAESGRIADVFATAMNRTLFDVSSLTEAMKYAGTAGAGFGMTLEETTAAVALFRNLGLEGSMAGTNFRMMLAEAARGSAEADRALKKYGLTVKDVNPELHSFAEIMQTVGKAGITTTDSIEVFGVRAGANVARLAAQFADGSTVYHKLLDDLQGSTGATQKMYDRMMDNVAGRFAILRSAVEELMLVVFDTFKGPLASLLGTMSEVVTNAAQQLSSFSVMFRVQLGDLFKSWGIWIKDNQDRIAAWLIVAAQAGVTVLGILTDVVPYLTTIAEIAGALFVAQKVYAFATAVQVAWVAVSELAAAFTAAGAAGTVATGGLLPLAAAITAGVLALGSFVVAAGQAEDAATRLAEAQRKVREETEAASRSYSDHVRALQDQRAKDARREREQLAAAGKLTQAEETRLRRIMDMTEAQAAAEVQAGRLVEVDGKLVEVATIIDEYGNEGVDLLQRRAAAMRASARADEESTRKMAESFDDYQKLVAGGMNATAAFRNTIARYGSTAEEVAARIATQTKAYEDQRAAAQALADTIVGEVGRAFEQEQAGVMRARAQRMSGETASEEQLRSKREAAARERVQMEEQVAAEVQAADGVTTSELRAQMIKRQQAVADAFDKEIATYSAGSAVVAELVRRRGETIAQVEEAYNIKLAASREEAAKRVQEVYDRSVATEQQQRNAEIDKALADYYEASNAELSMYEAWTPEWLAAMRRREAAVDEITRAITTRRANEIDEQIMALHAENDDKLAQIAAQRRRALLAAEGATAQQIGAINVHFDKLAQEEIERRDREAQERRKRRAAETAAAVFRGIGAVAGGIGSVVGSVAGGIGKLFGTLTGVNLNPIGAVQQLASDKREKGIDFKAGAREFVKGLVDGAADMLQAFVEGLPALIVAFVEELPRLIEAFVTALPEIIKALTDALPGLIQALADNLPPLINAVLDAVPLIIDAISAALPGVVTVVADLVVQILQGIPALVQAILDAVPGIILALVAGVPQIIQAVFNLIPVLIREIIARVPEIVQTLVTAVLGLVVMIVKALPGLITEIIRLVPYIVETLLLMVPDIVTAVIAAVPDIIFALIQGIPDIVQAIIVAIPEIIVALIKAIPQIIVALVEGLVVEIILQLPKMIGQAVKALVTGFIDGVKELFGGGDGKRRKRDRGGSVAMTGMEYVPATMRVTVHPGEVISDGRTGGLADRDPVLGGSFNPPAARAGRGGGGGGGPSEIAVLIGERVVDVVTVGALDSGNAPRLAKRITRTSGLVRGYDRGRFNPWGV